MQPPSAQVTFAVVLPAPGQALPHIPQCVGRSVAPGQSGSVQLGLTGSLQERHAAVIARAMAGHVAQALALLEDPESPTAQPHGRTGRRFTTDEVTGLLAGAGFEVGSVHGVRVFADLVPSALLDLEPGTTAALLDLERAVTDRPEYFPLATQLHLLASR